MADIDVKDFTLGTVKTVKTSTVGGKEITHHVITDTSGNAVGVTSNAHDINIKSGNPTTMPSTVADGADITLGAKADAKSAATDTTAITVMQVLKQISASVQAPPSQAVTNAGTFATQSAVTEADGANTTLGAKADAKSTATDTTAITVMQVLKQISASVQAPPSQAVTNAGTFAVQATNTKLNDAIAGEYETVAGSQTAQVLGPTGALGDFISGVLVIPATTSPGNVLLLDNATSITVFTGGASSVSNLVPFFINLGMYSVSGAWKLTTGANVSCIGIGNFT